MEADGSEELAPFPGEPLRTFADVVLGVAGHEADAVLAVVVLAGAGLWVEQVQHVLQFAEGSGEAVLALAAVGVDAVHAGPSVLAQVIQAVVDVGRAVVAGKAQGASATGWK